MIQFNQNLNRHYEKIVQKIRDLYNGNMSEQNAHDAARNFIGFCQLLLEMQAKRDQNRKKEV